MRVVGTLAVIHILNNNMSVMTSDDRVSQGPDGVGRGQKGMNRGA